MALVRQRTRVSRVRRTLSELKTYVRATRFRAARAANTEVRLYWSVGRDILDRHRAAGWGSKVVTSLAADLQREFPASAGCRARTCLKCAGWPRREPTEEKFVHHVGGRLPWRHVTSRCCSTGS